jgi:hypothetical protein
MSLFEGFEKGSGGTYKWNEEQKQFVKVSEQARDPNSGFNGPVWFPKGGHKYFDKAFQRTFYSKAEKKAFMRKHHFIQEGSSQPKCKGPEAGLGKIKYFNK